MKRNTAKRLATDERRRKVAHLRLQGWTQQAIAAELGVAQNTISLDLKTIHRRWQESMLDDFGQMRALELQKLDQLEREAWAAWERSQKPAQSAVIDSASIPDVANGGGNATSADNTKSAEKKRTRKTVKGQDGNPRFLQIVHQCVASRRQMLGLDAPQKLVPTDVEGRTITLTDLLGRIHSAAPPDTQALLDRSNVFDLEAEFARRAPPAVAAVPAALIDSSVPSESASLNPEP